MSFQNHDNNSADSISMPEEMSLFSDDHFHEISKILRVYDFESNINSDDESIVLSNINNCDCEQSDFGVNINKNLKKKKDAILIITICISSLTIIIFFIISCYLAYIK